MRWVTYRSALDGLDHAGLVQGGKVFGLPADVALIDLVGGEGQTLADGAAAATATPFEVIAFDDAQLQAPIPVPPSVRDFIAFENHYVDTRAGLGLEVHPVFYQQPSFYFSNPAAIVGPVADIPTAPGTAQFDFELEIGAVIGTPGSDLTLENAEQHVAGYTILCDWSARDLQAVETSFGNGPAKGKDTATGLGPMLVTPDELEPFRSGKGYDLTMRAYVNDVQWSDGNWSSIYWSMAQLLVFASRGTELRAGDVIGTGTVGTGSIMELSATRGSDRYPWLVPGDEVRLEVQELGRMIGRVVPGRVPAPLS